MPLLRSLVTLFTLLSLAGACLALVPTAPIIVRGHFTNAPAGDTVRLTYGSQVAKAALTPSGDFQLVLPNATATAFALLEYADNQTGLYLAPGDDVTLTLDYTHFDKTARYTGRGAAANNYLAQARWRFEYGPADGAEPRPREQVTATTTPAQMRQAADGFRRQRETFLAQYARRTPLPPAFQREERRHIELHWAHHLAAYPSLFQVKAERPVGLPPTYFDFVPGLHLQTLDAYRDAHPEDDLFVQTLLTALAYSPYLVPTGPLAAEPGAAARVYARATADFGRGRSRDQFMFQFLWSQLSRNNLAGVMAAMPTFRAENSDSVRGRNLRSMVQKQWALRPGQPAPPFVLRDLDGKEVALQDLRGKVVYLDFWGTWCAPCLVQMPALAAVKQQFAGRDVVFVYISVRDKEDKWRQVVVKEAYNAGASVHLRSATYDVPLQYDVREFPTYVLIGKDGRIQLTRAPRPTAGAELVSAIERALKE